MQTSIQKINIDENKWQGKNGCNEFLCISYPEIIYDIHKGYFDAGANVAVTNTFGAIASVLSEYGLEDKVVEIKNPHQHILPAANTAHKDTGSWYVLNLQVLFPAPLIMKQKYFFCQQLHALQSQLLPCLFHPQLWQACRYLLLGLTVQWVLI